MAENITITEESVRPPRAFVTITDARLAGQCVRGTRKWCEAHGFDFKDALKNGISEEKVLATGDAYGLQIIERKRAREAHAAG
jgi:hypothetical protein